MAKLPRQRIGEWSSDHLRKRSIASERPILINDSLSVYVRRATDHLRVGQEDDRTRTQFAEYLEATGAT
jgi:hypothetical protein